jgi:nucleotide-binding universal stress UspA family protein
MQINHILVPIDFSRDAEDAINMAISLAKELGARITLMHVIHDVYVGVGEMAAALPASYYEEIEEDVKREVQTYLSKVVEAGLQGDSIVVHGVPFQSILDTIADQHIDLVIMGTHGRTGLKHVLLGSVAEKVIRMATCPVMVTRPERHENGQ